MTKVNQVSAFFILLEGIKGKKKKKEGVKVGFTFYCGLKSVSRVGVLGQGSGDYSSDKTDILALSIFIPKETRIFVSPVFRQG